MLLGCDSSSITTAQANRPAAALPNSFADNQLANLLLTANKDSSNGVQTHLIDTDQDTLLLLEFDSEVIEPVLVAQPNTGISARQAMAEYELIAVVGSGFVSELESLTPVGLLQREGKTLSPVLGHGYTRILGINDNGLGVVHRNAFESKLFHSAIQVGPGIIEEGLLDISARDLQRPMYFRSFIMLCEDRWLAGVSLKPTHLRTLGKALLAFFAEQQWQCSDVVNLAGDRQALLMLADGTSTTFFHGDPQVSKVSLIGFKYRKR